ncbi:MAG TPA: hypothetical protein VK615_17815, partial [Candidatus Binatia bacterium]|nr:hypothetical protein [Candidatus Binatia bacterium]
MNWRTLFIWVAATSLSLHGQVPGDEHWDVRFGASGAENTVLAVMRHGSYIYIAGLFSFAGDVNATNIAQWDGADGHTVGEGLGTSGPAGTPLTYVYSLATDGLYLYAGGYFTNSGSTPLTSSVVRWDGTQWSPIGNLRGVPIHMQFIDGTLYAAGSLAVPGDTNTYAVARWNGVSWDTMGSVVSGCIGGFCTPGVINLLSDGFDLYAVGSFTTLGGVAANAAAKWNGASWESLGTGFSGTNVLVSGITMHNHQIYVSGIFQTAGGVAAQNMAVWNGFEWQPFSGANDEVRRIISDGTSLYAAGDFTTIGGTPALRTARWNGSFWTALGGGISSGLLDAALYGSELIVGGQFVQAGSAPAITVARWDGADWYALNSGRQNGMNLPLGVVRALDVFDGSLYAGGDFSGAGPAMR